MMSLYDYKVKKITGEEISLEEFKGKVLLIVNTASTCGFTPQFAGLQRLYDSHKEKGFEILGFPCNQFNSQDKGTNAEIHQFCKRNYGVTFPMFEKVDVNGPTENPLFTYLKSQKRGFFSSNVKWNFSKFLVDREGNVVARFSPQTMPENIEEKIVELL